MGTPYYMPPEQVRGEPVTPQSDLFSLCVLIYELLTRVRPFDADNTADMFTNILLKDPLPLSTYLPESSAKLDQLFASALAKEQQDRPQTVAEWAEDVVSCLKEIRSAKDEWNFSEMKKPEPSAVPNRCFWGF